MVSFTLQYALFSPELPHALGHRPPAKTQEMLLDTDGGTLMNPLMDQRSRLTDVNAKSTSDATRVIDVEDRNPELAWLCTLHGLHGNALGWTDPHTVAAPGASEDVVP